MAWAMTAGQQDKEIDVKRKPLTELEAVAIRDAQANAEAYFKLRDEMFVAEAVLWKTQQERDEYRAEAERLRGIVGAARLLILLAKPAYNAPLSWDEDRAVWLTANTSQDAPTGP